VSAIAEVTQNDFQKLIKFQFAYFTGDLNRPVESVNWFDAILYCNERSKRDGFDTVYSYVANSKYSADNHANFLDSNKVNYKLAGYRLPTEAEWEFACRGGTTTEYFCGYLQLGMYAWFSNNSDSITHPVAKKLPNPYGLYDVIGNVSEWCYDVDSVYASVSVTDPTGPNPYPDMGLRGGTPNQGRVLRGGEWNSDATALNSASRRSRNYGTIYQYYGFRAILQIP
jgi:formylglycine-generating enzyme required for sulfatase activity